MQQDYTTSQGPINQQESICSQEELRARLDENARKMSEISDALYDFNRRFADIYGAIEDLSDSLDGVNHQIRVVADTIEEAM